MTTTASGDRERIRALNDRLRTDFLGGCVNCTSGVIALPPEALCKVLAAVRAFTDFAEDNDPHGEHDFGLVKAAGQRVFFKIDYYDRAVQFGSPDPSDPAVTTRIMTIMLADEY